MARRDSAVLLVGVLLLALVSAVGVALSPIWRPDRPAAPWCRPNQAPAFSFGFESLSQQLGPTMGQATECEHGTSGSNDTFQRTTTGMAVYDWCTNTPIFQRGDERWALLPTGMVHWSGAANGPTQPVLREPNLREPCP
jgi:hypothetical protein